MMFIKRVKNKLLSFFTLELNFFYDYIKFKQHFTKRPSSIDDKNKLRAWILQDKHRIEKAFTLPTPRYCFGKDVIPRLINNIVEYKLKFGTDHVYYIGLGSLNAYKSFHLQYNQPLPDFFKKNEVKIAQKDYTEIMCNLAGYEALPLYVEHDSKLIADFMNRRRSCRNFDIIKSEDINDQLIKDITQLAITAPSVCNRQHWRVHYFKDELKNKVLDHQNGNVGFQKNIPFIAVVTSDIGAFYSANERNQPFVDGGIFSMNLMYAMQSYGLASCPLNWCNSVFTERNFRVHKLIPDNETIVLVLAFGYPSANALYAKSPRLPVEIFYKIY